MVDIFHMYKDQSASKDYSQDLFLHFKIEPKEDDEKSKESAAFIIETGFNLFIVFSNFMEANRENEQEEQVKEESEDDNLMENMKDSIIGKLVKLFFAIIKSVKETAMEQARKMQEMLAGKQELTLE